jgi:hypothetical protein
VVGVWALLYGLMAVLSTCLTVMTLGRRPGLLDAASRGVAPSDPTAAMQQAQALAPFVALMLPLLLVFWSVLVCAVYRTILQPNERGFGRLRLGTDEFRMMRLIAVLFLLMVATLTAYRIFGGLDSVVMAAGGGLGYAVGVLLRVAAALAFAAFWVRMSLAGPAAFVERKIAISRSWGLTRGHFWRLAAAYGLAVLVAVVIVILATVIFGGLVFTFAAASGVNTKHIDQMFQPDLTSIATLFRPAEIFNLAYSSILLVAIFVVLLSPAAVIHRSLAARA